MELEDLAKDIAALKARAEINEVLVRYCRALDRRDESMLRSCFHDTSTHDHGGFVGRSSEFCNFALDLLGKLLATHHHLGNISISVKENMATAELYYCAYHRMPGAGEMVFPEANPGDDVFISGRYIDRFERRNNVWLISHRRGTTDWLRFEPSADRGRFEIPTDRFTA